MISETANVGQRFPGQILDQDGSVFEFSKEGPELRLFFSGIVDELVQSVANDDCYIGLMRSGDIAAVPWKIGDRLNGDAQFHVFLYPPETRPTSDIMTRDSRYVMRIMLVDRDTGVVRVLRRVALTPELSRQFNEAIAYQLGNHIGREEYDAQVSIYQNQLPSINDVIAATPNFEKAEPYEKAGGIVVSSPMH